MGITSTDLRLDCNESLRRAVLFDHCVGLGAADCLVTDGRTCGISRLSERSADNDTCLLGDVSDGEGSNDGGEAGVDHGDGEGDRGRERLGLVRDLVGQSGLVHRCV